MNTSMNPYTESSFSLGFYARYGLRSLWRGGQRTFLSLVCIAFGVMSLVAMLSLGTLFTTLINTDPRLVQGGDLAIYSRDQMMTTDQVAQLEATRHAGIFSAYTLLDGTQATLLLKPNETGHAYLLGSKAFGIDPAVYPLVGTFTLRSTNQSLAQVLTSADSAMLTRDVADQLNLKVGDSFTISSLSSVTTRFTVTAIADRTPDNTGNAVYFTHAGAARLGFSPLYVIALLTPQGTQAINLLTDSLHKAGLDVNIATGSATVEQSAAVNLFNFMFKGAGILGLIIGGIGVVNTLQVMLARRTLEIAILKTVGYRERDLLALFGVELLLLGVIGTIIGAIAAIGLSALLVGLLSQTASLLIYWRIDDGVLFGGIAAGMTTTLVFGIFAVIQASGVRPAVLLHVLPRRLTISSVLNTIGLFAVLTIVFTVLCTVVMGSILSGVEIVLISFAGLLGLGVLFGVVMFIVTRLPLPRLGLLTLARNSLKRQRFRAIYALIALFVGVFTIGFASMAISTARARFTNHAIGLTGDNLAIVGTQADQPAIVSALANANLAPSIISMQVQVQADFGGNMTPLLLDGRENAPADLTLSGSAWGSNTVNAAYVPDRLPLPTGTALRITMLDGTSNTLYVVGTYQTRSISLIDQSNTLIVDKITALKLGGNHTGLLIAVNIPVDQLSTLTDSLGKTLPLLTVIGLNDLNDAIQRNISNFFLLAIGVAGLALVAGAVLIANSVGLAMVERRREMGILKAVGYNSRAVLGTIMLEQGLLGILGGIMGMVAVAISITLINQSQSSAQLAFNIPQAIVMIGVSLLIALGSAGLVAWSPTHQRPLTVLRDE